MTVADFNELQLRTFVREEMDRSALATRVRQLQNPAGSLLTVQRISGANESTAAAVNGAQIRRDATNPLALVYTPPVPCWIEARLNVGFVEKTDAAYHFLITFLRCGPADQDGVQFGLQWETQHSQVNHYSFRAPSRVFRCAANTAYTFDGSWNIEGGTWNYHQGAAYLYLEIKAWAR